ncbi:SGNH/GDSL hydrolase family protein [Geobacter grbiciae]|uniref:SGNH/GDSL hydrolase family protein n=1 Tax=Geobacter grbiciae TaxID=155042 RepID=UPI001C025D64|nr:SGNH/GDSL hydrolase family protein [Geobacter grbiciae]MBT1075696.1 SGNH/GDSL hydrolase family protein [Geobacter grbiciae]
MKTTRVNGWAVMGLLLALVLQVPGLASAQTTFGRIVVFGDSLSDPGNLFALEGGANTPPYNTLDQLLIPDKPYARGGHHFSNGATWVEQLSEPLGLAGNTRSAFQGSDTEATNYAVGGARAHDDGINVNLQAQVTAFLNAFGGAAPADALYVVEFGSNDIRDALAAGAAGGPILEGALASIGNNLGALYAAGARKFLICNAPDISLTPAVLTLDKLSPGAGQFASFLTVTYNSGLDLLLGSMAGLPGIEIVRVDFFQKLHELVATPATFGLSVVDSACIMPNTPPFACQNPDQFLFWDGTHPTRAVHAIMSQEAASALAN